MLYFLTYLQNFLQKPLKKDKGATAVEYGLMVAAIAAVIVVVVIAVGQQVLGAFSDVEDGLNNVGPVE